MRRPFVLVFAVLVLMSCSDVKTENLGTRNSDSSPPAATFTPDPTRGIAVAVDVQRWEAVSLWDDTLRWNDTVTWNAAVAANEAAQEKANAARLRAESQRQTSKTPPVSAETPSPHATGSVADAIAQAFGANAAAATRVAQCESGLDPAAVSPGGGNWGLFQINTAHRSHFAAVTGRPWSDVLDPYVNASFAAWLFHAEGWGPWTCGWAA